MPGVEPIEVTLDHDGVRYEAIHDGKSRDLDQNGGHIQATDIASGEVLWVRRAYKITYGPMSPHKYDRYIKAMEINAAGTVITVHDTGGEAHSFPLKPGLWARIMGMLGR